MLDGSLRGSEWDVGRMGPLAFKPNQEHASTYSEIPSSKLLSDSVLLAKPKSNASNPIISAIRSSTLRKDSQARELVPVKAEICPRARPASGTEQDDPAIVSVSEELGVPL